RHTRWPRDWSSDVCSSDLSGEGVLMPPVLIIFKEAPLDRGRVGIGQVITNYRHCFGLAVQFKRPPALVSVEDRVAQVSSLVLRRSEERRVGKECGVRRGRV